MPLRRVLVCTNGQAALRIVRACHAEGVEAVAVCGEGDRSDDFAVEADLGVAVGEEPTAGRLDARQIVGLAMETNCDAVHPGFDETALDGELALAVEEAGLLWIGPPADVVGMLASPRAARATFADLGVPVPGDPDAAEAGRVIEMGFLVDAEGDIHLLGSRAHTVLADGATVVEEGPALGLDPALEKRLTAAVTLVARCLGYSNAGTLRISLDHPRGFAVVGLDPRLQPGYPLIDAVTGQDSLRLQLRVVADKPTDAGHLPPPAREHAVWVSLQAGSDPSVTANRLPTTDVPGAELAWNIAPGRPSGGPGTRLGELLVHGPTRADALESAAAAVDALRDEKVPLANEGLGPALHRAAAASDLADPIHLGPQTPPGTT
ncbi:MAG: biotin carboxylase N-terminal domain-containing protein [Candidatus Dormibacteria bacterium]